MDVRPHPPTHPFNQTPLKDINTNAAGGADSEGDSDSDADGDAPVIVDASELQYSLQEQRLLREMAASLKPPYIATQRLQGVNSITANQQWPTIHSLHTFFSLSTVRTTVPRAIEWPLTPTIDVDKKVEAELMEPIRQLRRIMVLELAERFIHIGPTECELVAMALDPMDHGLGSLTDLQRGAMTVAYERQLAAMLLHMGIVPDQTAAVDPMQAPEAEEPLDDFEALLHSGGGGGSNSTDTQALLTTEAAIFKQLKQDKVGSSINNTNVLTHANYRQQPELLGANTNCGHQIIKLYVIFVPDTLAM